MVYNIFSCAGPHMKCKNRFEGHYNIPHKEGHHNCKSETTVVCCRDRTFSAIAEHLGTQKEIPFRTSDIS